MMKKNSMVLFLVPLILVACNKSENAGLFYSTPKERAPLPPHAPMQPLTLPKQTPHKVTKDKFLAEEQNKSETSDPIQLKSDNQMMPPKEGDLVKAGDLIMKLKEEKGRNPSSAEMIEHLQAHMNVNKDQAYLILEELGLE